MSKSARKKNRKKGRQIKKHPSSYEHVAQNEGNTVVPITGQDKAIPESNKSLLAFVAAIALSIFTIINFGGRFYKWFVGPKFEFALNNSKYGVADHMGSSFFFIRGDIYNSGYSPLRILEIKLDLKYNEDWVPMNIIYPPENLSIINLEDSSVDNINREKFNFLETIAQVDPKSSENGWIYGVISPRQFLSNQLLVQEEFEIRITCLTIDNKKYEQVFMIYPQPKEELRPLDS